MSELTLSDCFVVLLSFLHFFYFGTFCKSSGLQFMSENDFRYEAATRTHTHTHILYNLKHGIETRQMHEL